MAKTMGFSEYLSIFFKNNPEIFKLNAVSAPSEFCYPKYRLNLDYKEDYELLKIRFANSAQLSAITIFLNNPQRI